MLSYSLMNLQERFYSGLNVIPEYLFEPQD